MGGGGIKKNIKSPAFQKRFPVKTTHYFSLKLISVCSITYDGGYKQNSTSVGIISWYDLTLSPFTLQKNSPTGCEINDLFYEFYQPHL